MSNWKNRFRATLDNPSDFRQQDYINGFAYPENLVIIDEKPKIITYYNWGLILAWAKDEEYANTP